MKILLDNFAKIAKAEIIVDGITVITGKNSTGKTTVGKSFFAIFNALFDRENKIKRARENSLFRYVYNSAQKAFPDLESTVEDDFPIWNLGNLMISKIESRNGDETLYNDLYNSIQNYFDELDVFIEADRISGYCNDIINELKKINGIEKNQLLKEIVDRFFNQVFNGQINNLTNDEVSKIVLSIKENSIVASFQNNQCTDIIDSVNIMHEAFYIDNPFVLDELSYYSSRRLRPVQVQKQLLFNALFNKNEDILEGLVDAVSAKEKLSSIYEILETTVPGSFSQSKNGLSFVMPEYKSPIAVQNLSTGIKSFAIIKLLLERGALKEKDVLILDEPEIHLHPEWLLSYAEIIVLLQKHFNLSLIITTHSSGFLQAIEYYSEFYGVSENCKYYLSYLENNMCKFENVTGNTEKIYAEMIEPSVLLDNLRYNMEVKNDE